MRILQFKVLRGPNYWSNYRKKLIVLKIDLREFEELPSQLIPGFTENLKKLIPTLVEHRCSFDKPGGFFKRLDEGTWMGHVIEHIALELQWLAGMECGFGRTRTTSVKGIYNIVYSYLIEDAGIYAGRTALKIVKCIASNKPYTQLTKDILKLKQMYEKEKLGPSTKAIVSEAEKKDIPWTRLDTDSLIMLGQGVNQKIINATVTCYTSTLGTDIVANKELTKKLLKSQFIPMPNGVVLNSIKNVNDAINEVGFPLVVKPLGGNHGKGITTNITTKEKAYLAFKIAKKFSHKIIIEKFVAGFDYRLLLINFKLVAAALRTPAMITGTGTQTIQQLIDQENNQPQRGPGHENYLTTIKVDDVTRLILLDKGFTLETILPKGQVLYLKNAANLSSGGTAADVTNLVHPSNILLAERIARLVNLDICGIDIIAQDIAAPLTKDNAAVLEVNSGPGLRMHLAPSAGMKQNVAKPIVDMLFPNNAPARIPIVAVTGTNGKTTIVRLIANFAEQAGYFVGHTTTEGIYLQNKQIFEGDCAGPISAAVVLRDPSVNFAVLETSRGGILRSGIAFDKCNISIVTNVSSDHLGQDDINTLEDMARVKSVVPRSTADEGYAILNADDDLVYAMKQDLFCRIALFSMNHTNKRIMDHCQQGGLAAYVDAEWVVVQKGDKKIQVAKIIDIPLTFSGYSRCMVNNILPVVLCCFISQFSLQEITKYLTTYQPSPENNPGRMNFFNFDHFKVLIDYAHNEGAYIELRDFINKIDCNKKVGIVAATGDRRLIDIRKVGFYAAQMFDEIIIRQDRDGRGRTHQELTALIKEGIKEFNNDVQVRVIPNEFEAIQYAMDNAVPDTFIMYFPDEVLKAVAYVKQAHIIKRQASS